MKLTESGMKLVNAKNEVTLEYTDDEEHVRVNFDGNEYETEVLDESVTGYFPRPYVVLNGVKVYLWSEFVVEQGFRS